MSLPRAILVMLLGATGLPAGADAPRSAGCEPERVAELIERQRVAAFAQCLDARALAAAALDGLALDDRERKAFADGVAAVKRRVADNFMRQLESQLGRARLLPRRDGASPDTFVVRLDLIDPDGEPGGFNYIAFARTAEGRIGDWYSHAHAASASDVMRQFAATTIREPGALARLLGRQRFDRETAARFTQFAEHLRESRHAEALEALRGLPEGFQASRLGATLLVQVASNLDEDSYRDALDRLARSHGDAPELQFLLVDHHFFREDYDRAIEAVGTFESLVAEDGATNLLRCNALLMAERHPEARAACERSIALEPDFEPPRWSLATIGIKTRDARLTLDTLSGLETAFDYAFDPDVLLENEHYAWLADRPEFKAWADARR
jgi:tetratricopeptide (TPR) repeat protein